MHNPLEQTLALIDMFLAGDVSEPGKLDELAARGDLPEHVAKAVHELLHYIGDADIRRADPEYEEHWRGKLDKMRKALALSSPQ